MLQNVVDYGTAKNITLDKKINVAGKTGTSQDYFDRWFVGYTPYCIGGVWYGYEYPKPLNNDTKYICTKFGMT
jgi:penicillin-binding protein 1A